MVDPTEKNDPTPWPNKRPVVDGVTPSDEVPQDPDLEGLDDDLDREMKD
jgi:hypothetical protein